LALTTRAIGLRRFGAALARRARARRLRAMS
jgi:hypothetical protein